MAGFLPTKWVKRLVEEGEVKPSEVNGKKFVKLRLKNLLYGGGLRSYQESLAENKGVKTSKELEGANDEQKVSLSNPNLAQSYYNRGVGRYQTGNKLGAIEEYNKAIQYNPQFIQAYYNRGIVRSEMGKYTAAIALYSQNRGNAYLEGDIQNCEGKVSRKAAKALRLRGR